MCRRWCAASTQDRQGHLKDSMGSVPEDGISRTYATLKYMRSWSTCAAGVHAQLEYMRSFTPSGMPSATLRPSALRREAL